PTIRDWKWLLRTALPPQAQPLPSGAPGSRPCCTILCIGQGEFLLRDDQERDIAKVYKDEKGNIVKILDLTT
ncbi:MAG: hypothetical protein ACYSU0_17170, partial [Planctomycetota bacterium]